MNYIIDEEIFINYASDNDSYEDIKNILVPQLVKNGMLKPIKEIYKDKNIKIYIEEI